MRKVIVTREKIISFLDGLKTLFDLIRKVPRL